jgi:hypothetical protein
VTVNGAGTYTASLPPTGGWGTNGRWNLACVDLPLIAGEKVVTFSKGVNYAEIDFVFISDDLQVHVNEIPGAASEEQRRHFHAAMRRNPFCAVIAQGVDAAPRPWFHASRPGFQR